MSGTPTETEVRTQWRNSVALLEAARLFADGTVVGAGGLMDTLMQSLEGEYTPDRLSVAARRFRAGLSGIVSSERASEFLTPILFEYGNLISSGGGYRDVGQIAAALYEHFVATGQTVKSRGITFDAAGTPAGGNVGNGSIVRLTVDENGFPIESCHVEAKRFRCRRDRNSGAQEQAEEFEVLGEAASQDALLLAQFGSGDSRATIRAMHAGSAAGGSLLNNSSWSTYNAAATPKFASWTETAGGAQVVQDVTNTYRSFPGAATNASLRINGGGGTVTLTQPLSAMRIQALDPTKPYFLRVMVNKTIGTAAGGSVTLRMGSQSVTTTIAALATGWTEVRIPLTAACWFRTFNQNPFTIQVEWSGSTSGYLLVDDALFGEWTRLDGTYWVVRQAAASPVAWLVDDVVDFTDTGGLPTTGKLQWWFWVAGFGYLPSTSGTPTFTDP